MITLEEPLSKYIQEKKRDAPFTDSIESWWENLDPVRKPAECKCWSGLDVDGEKLVRTERSVIPGILTGAELPNNPELARPADIELLIGELVSLWIDSTKFRGSSRCNSSNAFPKNIKQKKQQIIRVTKPKPNELSPNVFSIVPSDVTHLLQIQRYHLDKMNLKVVKR